MQPKDLPSPSRRKATRKRVIQTILRSVLTIGCITSYLCSGHTGIYHAQRVGHSKHHGGPPEELRIADVPQFRKKQQTQHVSATKDDHS